MKSCVRNRRLFALMAAGALDTATASTLRAHLEICPGCRQYWGGMSDLLKRLDSSELPDAQLPRSFHARLVQRIYEEKASPILTWLAVIRQIWSGRRLATVTVAAALAVAAIFWVQNLRHNNKRTASPVMVQAVTEAPAQRMPVRTLASYHRAANVSLENLDAVLAREVAPRGASVETLTPASLLARSLED